MTKAGIDMAKECTKVKFANEGYAKFYLDKIRKTSKRGKVPVSTYLCKCGSWHLTSQINHNDTNSLVKELSILKQLHTELKTSYDAQILKLKLEIDYLKGKHNREDNISVKADSRILALQNRIKKEQEFVRVLRISNSDSISKIIQLQKKLDTYEPDKKPI